jgi:hypothetical protein
MVTREISEVLGEFAGNVESKKKTSVVESNRLVTIAGKSKQAEKILCVGEMSKLEIQVSIGRYKRYWLLNTVQRNVSSIERSRCWKILIRIDNM